MVLLWPGERCRINTRYRHQPLNPENSHWLQFRQKRLPRPLSLYTMEGKPGPKTGAVIIIIIIIIRRSSCCNSRRPASILYSIITRAFCPNYCEAISIAYLYITTLPHSSTQHHCQGWQWKSQLFTEKVKVSSENQMDIFHQRSNRIKTPIKLLRKT